jgi:hypothetical protein
MMVGDYQGPSLGIGKSYRYLLYSNIIEISDEMDLTTDSLPAATSRVNTPFPFLWALAYLYAT